MWIHGNSLYRDTLIEVEEMKEVKRGHPKVSLGWRARLVLPSVEIVTTSLRKSQAEAEKLLIIRLNNWTDSQPE